MGSGSKKLVKAGDDEQAASDMLPLMLT